MSIFLREMRKKKEEDNRLEKLEHKKFFYSKDLKEQLSSIELALSLDESAHGFIYGRDEISIYYGHAVKPKDPNYEYYPHYTHRLHYMGDNKYGKKIGIRRRKMKNEVEIIAEFALSTKTKLYVKTNKRTIYFRQDSKNGMLRDCIVIKNLRIALDSNVFVSIISHLLDDISSDERFII